MMQLVLIFRQRLFTPIAPLHPPSFVHLLLSLGYSPHEMQKVLTYETEEVTWHAHNMDCQDVT